MLFLNRILYPKKKKSLLNLGGEHFFVYKKRKKEKEKDNVILISTLVNQTQPIFSSYCSIY